DLILTERDLGAALVELCGALLQIRLERVSKPLTKPHAVSIELVQARETPLSGGGRSLDSSFPLAWNERPLPCSGPRGLCGRDSHGCPAAHRARRLSLPLDGRPRSGANTACPVTCRSPSTESWATCTRSR